MTDQILSGWKQKTYEEIETIVHATFHPKLEAAERFIPTFTQMYKDSCASQNRNDVIDSIVSVYNKQVEDIKVNLTVARITTILAEEYRKHWHRNSSGHFTLRMLIGINAFIKDVCIEKMTALENVENDMRLSFREVLVENNMVDQTLQFEFIRPTLAGPYRPKLNEESDTKTLKSNAITHERNEMLKFGRHANVHIILLHSAMDSHFRAMEMKASAKETLVDLLHEIESSCVNTIREDLQELNTLLNKEEAKINEHYATVHVALHRTSSKIMHKISDLVSVYSDMLQRMTVLHHIEAQLC